MAEITGQIKGAYREEGFILDNSGNPVTLVDILNMILTGEVTLLGATNGLNIFENQVYLGGTLIEDTQIINLNQYIQIGRNTVGNKSYINQDSVAKRIDIVTADEDYNTNLLSVPGAFSVQVEDEGTNIAGSISISPEESSIGVGTLGDPYDTGFRALTDHVQIVGVRTYANDAAAQADGTLPVNGLYRLNADPVLRIKI